MRKHGSGLDFTKKESNRTAVRYKGVYIIALCCCFIIVGAFSFMWLWRSVDYDFNNMFAGRKTTQASTESSTEPVTVALEGSSSILFVHTSDGGGVLRSVCVLKLDFGEGTEELYPCALDALCVYNNRSMTVEECYNTYGPAALRSAIKGVTGFSADRYFRMRDSGFINIVKLLGDISYKNDAAVSYTSDELVLELPVGEQMLNPSNALKLVKYNNTVKSTGDAALGNALVLGSAFCQYFTQANVQKGEELFSSVVNLSETDISVLDYTNTKEKTAAFVSSAERQAPVIIAGTSVLSPFTTLSAEVSVSD